MKHTRFNGSFNITIQMSLIVYWDFKCIELTINEWHTGLHRTDSHWMGPYSQTNTEI